MVKISRIIDLPVNQYPEIVLVHVLLKLFLLYISHSVNDSRFYFLRGVFLLSLLDLFFSLFHLFLICFNRAEFTRTEAHSLAQSKTHSSFLNLLLRLLAWTKTHLLVKLKADSFCWLVSSFLLRSRHSTWPEACWPEINAHT